MEIETTFGAWLRQRRHQLDLTQMALAERVGYSVVTIRKLERDELRPSKQLAERLAHGLDLTLDQQTEVITFARSAHPASTDAPPVQPSAQSHLPPQLTPFFGRTTELLELGQTLADPACHLLTLVGPGGIGKTRLALEFAETQRLQTPDGVHFVSLASLRSSEHIVPAIAEALAFQFQADGRLPQQQLLDYLRYKQALLVLDNFEHLLDAVELIQALLEGCPLLRLLVTSRERLRLSSETVFRLEGMDLPEGTTVQEMLTYSVVQLFVTTARRTDPKFDLNGANAQDVVQICRLVGGMPLALILAAAWVEVLSPQEIATELKQGFSFLEAELRDLPDRHHSMRAVFAQSWQRLGEVERAVFMRLSLFRDGFTRQAAQRVAGASLPTLSVLVNKSLVQRDADGRYNLHELLRQYAEEELETAGQKADAGAAHAAFFLNFLQQREPDLKGRRQLAALGEINENYENIRAAWLWAVQAHNYAAIDHALNALFHWFFWLQRSRQHEGVALLQNARQTWASSAQARAHRVWGHIQARLLGQRGPWLEKPIETQQRIEEALLLARQHGDPHEISFCQWAFGLALVSEEALLNVDVNLQRAIDCFEESLAAYRARGDHFWVAQTLEKMGHAYRRINLCDLAVPLLEESLSLRRTLGDHFGEARCLRELAWARFHQGRERVTLEVARAAYELEVELGDQEGIADSRFLLAVYLLVSGDIQQAKTLFRAVEQYAVEANATLYREWTTVANELIRSMEESMRLLHLPSPPFPNRITPFSSSLVYLMFGVSTNGLATDYHRHLQELFGVATTTSESALCLFLAPYLLAHVGEQKRAVTLMALAFRYPEIAGSWLLYLPWYVTLQEELRREVPPEEFAGAWAEGQLLDLQHTFVEVRQELATMRHRLETLE